VDHVLFSLDDVAEVIRQGAPAAQKKAITAVFERIEVDWGDEITKAVPREWCRPLFLTLQSLFTTCDLECPQGSLNPRYVAELQLQHTAKLKTLLDLV
jgi:hypothetical protein